MAAIVQKVGGKEGAGQAAREQRVEDVMWWARSNVIEAGKDVEEEECIVDMERPPNGDAW